MKFNLTAGTPHRITRTGSERSFYIVDANGHLDIEYYRGLKNQFKTGQGLFNLTVGLTEFVITSETNQTVDIWFGVGEFVDNSTFITGTLDTQDATAHTKLDTIATANQTTATAVQGLNSKLDGQYMAGIVPVGTNNASRYGNGLVFNSGSTGAIIRTMSGHIDDGYLTIGGAKIWEVNNNAVYDWQLSFQLKIAPNTNISLSNTYNSNEFIHCTYDFI